MGATGAKKHEGRKAGPKPSGPTPRETAEKLVNAKGWSKAYRIAGDTASRFARKQDDPRWTYWKKVGEELRDIQA